MKRCATCGEVKDESEFNWRWKRLGIRHPTCRECHRAYQKNWYDKNKETHLKNVYERKQRVILQAREYISTLAGQGYSIEAIQSEIDKCQVLCANCHRRKTAKERGDLYAFRFCEIKISRCEFAKILMVY